MNTAAESRIPLADLSLQWRQVEAEVRPELDKLFEASAFTLGPWVERFETAVAAYLDVPHAIGVNSGTSALHLAMIAAGIGPGDEVLVPANTFVATAWAVAYVGAPPRCSAMSIRPVGTSMPGMPSAASPPGPRRLCRCISMASRLTWRR